MLVRLWASYISRWNNLVWHCSVQFTDLCMRMFLQIGVCSVTACARSDQTKRSDQEIGPGDLDTEPACDARVSGSTGSIVGTRADSVTWAVGPVSPVDPPSSPLSCVMQGVLTIEPPAWVRQVYVGMEFENPNRFSFHLTDSPTSYGFGKISANGLTQECHPIICLN